MRFEIQRLRVAAAPLLLLAATSCSCSSSKDEVHLEQLAAPTLVTAHMGMCDAWYALDANGQGWVSKGCEGDPLTFTKTHAVSKQAQADVTAAFRALPATPVSGCDSSAVTRYTIWLHRTGSAEGTWHACLEKDASGRLVVGKIYADADRLLTTAVGD